MAMLEVKDLEVYYGVIQAIKGISFTVNEGEVIALIGANGAGKTTTLQTITGMLSPKKGSILFEGERGWGCVLNSYCFETYGIRISSRIGKRNRFC